MKSFVNSIQWGKKEITQIEIYDRLPSTNSLGRQRIEEGCPTGTVIWAWLQTKGKGRHGKKWLADQSSLTFSVLWQFPNYQSLTLLPLALGLGITQVLSEIVPGVKIKWPNDLWIGKRKLGGILVESGKWDDQLWAIVGVGLNINGSLTKKRGLWVSLEEASGHPWSRLAILNLALQGAEKGLQFTKTHPLDLNPHFRRYGNFLDQPIILHEKNRSWQAIARKVLPDGRLLVENEAGLFAVLPQEISVRFPG